MSWYNNDGLLVKFDAERIVKQAGGEYPGGGHLRVIEFRVDLSKITNGTATIVSGADLIIVPRNVVIQEVETFAETVGATWTSLDIGLIRLDRTTELDYDGLLDAFPVANMSSVGEVTSYTAGVSLAGVLVGTETAYPGLFCVTVNGSDGTGILRCRVKIFVKDVDQSPTNY